MKRDSQLFDLINKEQQRQAAGLELIASENYVTNEVLEAMGSVCTNKYAEGYPGKRYYGGCEVVDQIEQLAIDRLCALYDAEYANVQPHSGAQANMAVTMAILKPGDTFMGLDLSMGGHLTHGSPVNASGILYRPSSSSAVHRPIPVNGITSACAPLQTKWAPSCGLIWPTPPASLPRAS